MRKNPAVNPAQSINIMSNMESIHMDDVQSVLIGIVCWIVCEDILWITHVLADVNLLQIPGSGPL